MRVGVSSNFAEDAHLFGICVGVMSAREERHGGTVVDRIDFVGKAVEEWLGGGEWCREDDGGDVLCQC